MNKHLNKIIGVITIIIAGTFTYFGQSQYLVNNILLKYTKLSLQDISVIKEYLLIIGIVFLVVPSSLRICYLEIQNDRYKAQNIHLWKELRNMLLSTLESTSEEKNSGFKFRIFTPKTKNEFKFTSWRTIFVRKTYAIIKHIEGFTQVYGFDGFKLEIFPNKQGLVGECFHSRSIVYDEELEQTNQTQYNLNDFHKSKTKDFKFCVCVPIFDEENKILGVLSVDTSKKITLTQNQKKEFFMLLTVFSSKLDGDFKKF